MGTTQANSAATQGTARAWEYGAPGAAHRGLTVLPSCVQLVPRQPRCTAAPCPADQLNHTPRRTLCLRRQARPVLVRLRRCLGAAWRCLACCSAAPRPPTTYVRLVCGGANLTCLYVAHAGSSRILPWAQSQRCPSITSAGGTIVRVPLGWWGAYAWLPLQEARAAGSLP